RQDLRFLLDTSRSDPQHRAVTLRLSRGRHDLAISYLVPSPTWRVSYRVVAESAANGGAAEKDTGTLLLQGWGLFDNRLEEDLEDVGVTLVAGQPISFVYDLATSHIPTRRVVHDQARVAAGPVEFDQALDVQLEGRSARRAPAAAGAVTMAYEAAAAPAPRQTGARLRADLAQQPVAATASELGELFQYRVMAPVTVKRGASALVPILAAELPYRRELLFNEQKLAQHPVAALRFTNGSGLVLERGPVTVLEDGAYRGEALVPFTKAGNEVYLAFSVELGIKVKSTTATRVETAGLRIEKALLWLKQARIVETTYQLSSELGAPEVVTVEHPILPGHELVATRAPDEQTADWYRWTVPAAPRAVTSFVVSQRIFEWEQQYLLDLSYDALAEFLGHRWLDAPTMERIRALLQERAAIARNEQEIEELHAERDRIYQREEQLRKNLAALTSTGQEATLRQQVFTHLQASEDRLTAIDQRITALQEQNAQRQAALDAALQALTVEETSGATPTPAEAGPSD
ncbi:MAG TPA: hypothetical protein VHS99_17770, partial [Chloroflexota bacterium]|nr:hypothetical protein [Chloroflexota bacterium]